MPVTVVPEMDGRSSAVASEEEPVVVGAAGAGAVAAVVEVVEQHWISEKRRRCEMEIGGGCFLEGVWWTRMCDESSAAAVTVVMLDRPQRVGGIFMPSIETGGERKKDGEKDRESVFYQLLSGERAGETSKRFSVK